MKLIIEGRTYDVIGRKSANLRHLFEMRRQSVDLLGYEMGLSRLDDLERVARATRAALAAARAAGDDDKVAALRASQAEEGMLGLAVTVFLSRRKAGDAVSFAEALDFDMGALEFVEEPGDKADAGAEEPDPTTPGSGGPVTSGSGSDVPAARGKTKSGRSTRTVSKSRSASGSH